MNIYKLVEGLFVEQYFNNSEATAPKSQFAFRLFYLPGCISYAQYGRANKSHTGELGENYF